MSALLPAPQQPADRFPGRDEAAARSFRLRLSTAIERLAGEGTTYAELTVERLIREAGVSRSTFYKYFGDKTRLLSSLAETVQVEFLRAANSWLELPSAAEQSDYGAAFATIFHTYRSHRVVMRSISEQANHDPVIRDHFARMMDAFVTAVEQHIRQGQNAGSIVGEHSAHDLAVWLTWMLEHGQLLFVGPATEFELEQYTSAATEIVWRALYSLPNDE
ncbi:TetR/AcrR family transcriptional regulator [Mycobacteroides franklinii]|uniref:HTH-type transcriptional regulator EthR n=1 Tax=Mycobacteroides franklinii TaxID=948102 RepID=A0A4R8R5D8_9MYCO|nr:TetR/AcrR family transcriptional regulator [Mycobacteroides franklinii]TDZ44060.1 HTH-type transcriptional regulator EthR [Mycobacteroides franklinii]TDZ51194.1 HTH-type transcriptional regulator EthR [Mycobacteroides franklinii]TDZ57614.1 HTH-type transcriptional regulator EthR [Mycobacteroides franklinii]TDZ64556.1 HTH-type transcriptional regulator EthR [Mycobacteroides franklinii]TDZ70953.1 HTH-type transcriptional regulator EthR [Mycobacteroides franklinii]